MIPRGGEGVGLYWDFRFHLPADRQHTPDHLCMQGSVEFSVLGASTDHGRGQFYHPFFFYQQNLIGMMNNPGKDPRYCSLCLA
jgi:hypothetical protein